MLIRDVNAKMGKEKVWNDIVGFNSFHTESNDHGERVNRLYNLPKHDSNSDAVRLFHF